MCKAWSFFLGAPRVGLCSASVSQLYGNHDTYMRMSRGFATLLTCVHRQVHTMKESQERFVVQ
jgi:hypothetical protein